MRSKSGERRLVIRRNLILLFSVVALLIGGYFVMQSLENGGDVQTRGVSAQNIGQRRKLEYDGHSYAQRTGMTTILLMGVDREEEEERYVSARVGGQADFLMLLVIDHNDKTIRQLQIDRDTMTAIQVYGVLGNPVGTRVMQICLSHGFGKTPEACCHNTVLAVSGLLMETKIDYYMAVNISAMQKVNHILGGVTVTLEQDFTQSDPDMKKGATLTLTDRQAAIFLRARMAVGRGTNEERMARHRAYLTAATEKILGSGKDGINYFSSLYSELETDMTTNLDQASLLSIANMAYYYTVEPIAQLNGEHTVGDDGFIEFHTAQGAAEEWVIQTLYDLLH